MASHRTTTTLVIIALCFQVVLSGGANPSTLPTTAACGIMGKKCCNSTTCNSTSLVCATNANICDEAGCGPVCIEKECGDLGFDCCGSGNGVAPCKAGQTCGKNGKCAASSCGQSGQVCCGTNEFTGGAGQKPCTAGLVCSTDKAYCVSGAAFGVACYPTCTPNATASSPATPTPTAPSPSPPTNTTNSSAICGGKGQKCCKPAEGKRACKSSALACATNAITCSPGSKSDACGPTCLPRDCGDLGFPCCTKWDFALSGRKGCKKGQLCRAGTCRPKACGKKNKPCCEKGAKCGAGLKCSTSRAVCSSGPLSGIRCYPVCVAAKHGKGSIKASRNSRP